MASMIQSGPRGRKTRSDVHVIYTPGNTPLNVQVESDGQYLQKKEIHGIVEKTLLGLGIKQGEIKIDDFGALPYVIMARIETVVKRAYPDIDQEVLPDIHEHAGDILPVNKLRRSCLYLPGNQPKLALKAGSYKPDGLIFDLEDSVPAEEKEAARYLVRNALRALDLSGCERFVRINLNVEGDLDLESLLPQNIQGIVLPKAETAAQISALDKKVKEILHRKGLKKTIYIIPLIESALGVLNAREIAMASKNNIALAIGLEDYTMDIGTHRTLEGKESLFARSMLVNVARAAGLQAMDSVFSDVSDEAGLSQTLKETRALGFDGMACIHPRQIDPIHDAFTPAEAEITAAKRIVVAATEAKANGLGVIAVDSKMVDLPVVKRAERTLGIAISAGRLSENWQNDHQVATHKTVTPIIN